jgi:cytidylate kinase
MVAIQQSYGLKSNVVMDGRDIGSVVFPNATIKLWVTASVEKRAYRRWLEYQNKGESILLKKVIENLTFRDKNDENRTESPLVRPLNSIEINNTSLNAAETLENALILIKKHLEN